MSPVRTPQPADQSILSSMLAVRLQQLEVDAGGVDRFILKLGIARGTYHHIARGTGNPTFKTIEKIAKRLNLSVFELLGFEVDDARRALKKSGVDYDSLVTALEKQSEAGKRVARETRSRKLAV